MVGAGQQSVESVVTEAQPKRGLHDSTIVVCAMRHAPSANTTSISNHVPGLQKMCHCRRCDASTQLQPFLCWHVRIHLSVRNARGGPLPHCETVLRARPGREWHREDLVEGRRELHLLQHRAKNEVASSPTAKTMGSSPGTQRQWSVPTATAGSTFRLASHRCERQYLPCSCAGSALPCCPRCPRSRLGSTA